MQVSVIGDDVKALWVESEAGGLTGPSYRRGPWGFSRGTGSETRGKALATGLES